jgi:hypothetical protein
MKRVLGILFVPTTMGAPYPRISCGAWWNRRTSCGFPYRKPHTRPWVVPRTGIRVSDPLLVRCGIPRRSTGHFSTLLTKNIKVRAYPTSREKRARYGAPIGPWRGEIQKMMHTDLFLISHPRRCRPAGYETGHFLSPAEGATNPRVLPAVPNTNRGLIENLFLLRKPHPPSTAI